MSEIVGMDSETLERYLDARKTVGKLADRLGALSHLLSLLKHCGDDTVEVSANAMGVVGDMLDADVCAIQETLDGFLHLLDAEEAIVSMEEIRNGGS